jgi:hypothetical protein
MSIKHWKINGGKASLEKGEKRRQPVKAGHVWFNSRVRRNNGRKGSRY